ncbi:MAG: AbrB/MazE/SpoVT family DNA-binding domain-containing protein [Candidatus Diapherotrites archaeon]|nr:AbrB/MazE/SpoVT family DNA-binding domain-containing protein [Candidatus Diapherotrites archaeon]
MAVVERVGEELAIKLPKFLVDKLGLKEGDRVDFNPIDEKSFVVKRLESLSSKELDVLRKINQIRFFQRTKDAVEKNLTVPEKKILDDLMKKGVVSFYNEGKYKQKGVYSISRDYYPLLVKRQAPKDLDKRYLDKGYIITEDPEEARNIIRDLQGQIKSGEVASLRSFDKKYYFVSSSLINSAGSEIVANLEQGSMTLDELAESCGLEKDLVKAVIEVLRESGDILEKKKGVYALA